MKFIIDNWMLISVALFSGALLLWPVIQGAAVSGVDPATAVQLMNREKAVVVDVCDAGEFAAGHVGGAKNVPLAELEKKLPGVVKNKALPLILVCQSGARSAPIPTGATTQRLAARALAVFCSCLVGSSQCR